MPIPDRICACGRALVAGLARLMPIDSPGLCMALSLLFLVTATVLLPEATRLARAAPVVAEALEGWPRGWSGLRVFEWAGLGAACAGAGIFQARCLQLCYPERFDPYGGLSARPRALGRRPGNGAVELAGMRVEEADLRTSVLVTGVTGSSKTAGVLMPLLAQLLRGHRREDGEGGPRTGRPKLGAFIPEVKGDLVDGCIYLAHEAGRCVSRDVMILTPCSRIPVVRYRDERGRHWHLCARGGAGGSEAGAYLPSAVFPPGHPRAGRPISPAIFENEAEAEAAWPELAGRSVPLRGRQPRFIGWRWEGRRLRRVSHTAARNRPVPLAGAGGAAWAEPPSELAPVALLRVDNGLHYNLVDDRLPAPEAAERLTRLAAMARGGSNRGENEYFYEQARKLIGACIALHRAVESAPCTAADIVRLAARENCLAEALDALERKMAQPPELADGLGDEDERSRRVLPWRELSAYFREEWRRMVADGKTANVIKSIISAGFDPFLRDPDLAGTFCRPSTFFFEDIAQQGRIIALVPGERYEQLGRLLGTACKMDFQSSMLARSVRPDLDSSRLVLYFADECHKYVTSGSSTAGDPYFMNLSRSNNVVNICATQSYAWIIEVIGREAANVYLSAFGVQFWLQQTDPETCRRAAEICGTVTREKVSAEHDFDWEGVCGTIARGRGLGLRRRVREERAERYRAEDFGQLDVGEIIAYNKGRPGRAAKVAKGRARYHFCTQRPAGAEAVNGRVREYYRELMENLTFERGQCALWNP